MILRNTLKLLLTGVFLFSFASAFSQESADDSADVWSVIEQEWNADEEGDRDWPDSLLTENFSGWGYDSPAPRSKTSTKMWDRFGEQLGKMVAHELYPLSIVVHDDVAVATLPLQQRIQVERRRNRGEQRAVHGCPRQDG